MVYSRVVRTTRGIVRRIERSECCKEKLVEWSESDEENEKRSR